MIDKFSLMGYICSLLLLLYFIYTCIDKLSWTHIDSLVQDIIEDRLMYIADSI